MEINKIPTKEQVKLIYKDTYNLYIKYINSSSDIDYKRLVEESRELFLKYPFKLCETILTEINYICSHKED